MSAVLIKREEQSRAAQPALADDRDDRTFGLQVYSAFLILARAFYRRYVGGEPKCKNCGGRI